MADKPILFSAPMVKALLAGTKTQTRRHFSADPYLEAVERTATQGWRFILKPGAELSVKPPRTMVGDRLYVREHWRTWAQYDGVAPRDFTPGTHVAYEASESPNLGDNIGRFRQGMHMPRWASRLTLTVTDVRVERLQDCSVADAIAEGIRGNEHEGWLDYSPGDKQCDFLVDPRQSYRTLWNSISGDAAWEANPWVAAYTFTVERGNIDALAKAA